VPLIAWGFVVWGAYHEKDLRERHWLLPRDDGSTLEDIPD